MILGGKSATHAHTARTHGLGWRTKKSSLGVALQRGRTQVMFLDGKSATHAHTARTHGHGWRRRKSSLGFALQRGRAEVMFLEGNRAVQHTRAQRARTDLAGARGACKLYRCERPYDIPLRQLPPRFVRALLV